MIATADRRFKFHVRPSFWTLLVLGALLGAAAAGAQPVPDRPGAARSEPQAIRVYEGVSRRGNLQEALDDAVARALRALPGADRMVRYRVREITGEQGGIAGVNVLRVTIEVQDEGGRRPDRPGSGDGEERPAALEVDLQVAPGRLPRAGEATFTLTLRNRSDRMVVLPFTSSQRYDFEVRRGERVLWQWSHDRVFAQVLGQLAIRPGEALTYREKWNVRTNTGDRVPPGDYTVRGYLTPAGPRDRPSDTAPLVVEE